jgi:catechol 2,3-dioxygenase-like lactoylglutathione lyase family enzyme
MALKRMDNVGIVVEDLGGAIDFFRELGLELHERDRGKARHDANEVHERQGTAA